MGLRGGFEPTPGRHVVFAAKESVEVGKIFKSGRKRRAGDTVFTTAQQPLSMSEP
jgi:hypothetical protein